MIRSVPVFSTRSATPVEHGLAADAQRVRVFGEDAGPPPAPPVPGVRFTPYAGNHGGQAYQVDLPEGWSTLKLASGVAFYDPADPSTAATFQWHMNNGRQTPGGLVEKLLKQTDASDVWVLSQRSEPARQTPMGPLEALGMELRYQAQGTRVRGEIHAGVCNAPNAYIPFWSGTLNAVQAGEARWSSVAPTLRHMVRSFKAG